MPKIPTFKQPGQGFGIQPALENSQAGRAKGEQFGAFARTAASAVGAAQQYQARAEKADTAFAKRENDSATRQASRKLQAGAIDNSNANGTDIIPIYEKSMQGRRAEIDKIENSGHRATAQAQFDEEISITNLKLASTARQKFDKNFKVRMQKDVNSSSAGVYADPLSVHRSIIKAKDHFDEISEGDPKLTAQRSAAYKMYSADMTKASVLGLIDRGQFEAAKNMHNELRGNLTVEQNANLGNRIIDRQLQSTNKFHADIERNRRNVTFERKERLRLADVAANKVMQEAVGKTPEEKQVAAEQASEIYRATEGVTLSGTVKYNSDIKASRRGMSEKFKLLYSRQAAAATKLSDFEDIRNGIRADYTRENSTMGYEDYNQALIQLQQEENFFAGSQLKKNIYQRGMRRLSDITTASSKRDKVDAEKKHNILLSRAHELAANEGIAFDKAVNIAEDEYEKFDEDFEIVADGVPSQFQQNYETMKAKGLPALIKATATKGWSPHSRRVHWEAFENRLNALKRRARKTAQSLGDAQERAKDGK